MTNLKLLMMPGKPSLTYLIDSIIVPTLQEQFPNELLYYFFKNTNSLTIPVPKIGKYMLTCTLSYCIVPERVPDTGIFDSGPKITFHVHDHTDLYTYVRSGTKLTFSDVR